MAEGRSRDPAPAGGAPPNGAVDNRSTAELMKALSDQTTTLVRQEIELAKAELTAKGQQMGIGAGAFGGAAVVGLFAFGALSACFVLALSLAMDGWLAALIVAVVYAAVAGVLALVGRKQTQAASPPVPERAISSTKEDVEWAKTSAKSGRR
jgi:MFS family permease